MLPATRPAVIQGVPTAAVTVIIAAMILETGSSIRGHLLFLLGLPLTIVAFVIAASAIWAVGGTTKLTWLKSTSFWLSVMATAGLLNSSLHGPAWYEVSRYLFYVGGLIGAGILTGGNRQTGRRVVQLLILIALILHLLTPLALPDPGIDVWTWTQTCVRALLHGIQPYGVQAPDEWNGAFDYGYSLTVYPYPPATLLAYAPVVAMLDDFRYLLAFSLPATIAFIRATGARLHVDEALVDVITLAIVLHPRSLSFTAFGWTEPLLVVVAAAFVYLVVKRPRGLGQAAAFFLLPALKQYVLVPTILYLAMKPARNWLRTTLFGLAVAGLTVVPFLVWDWRLTLSGIVFQAVELKTPRLDSDSLIALAGVVTGTYPGRWWSVAVQFVVGGIAYWRLKDAGLAGLLLASAITMFATFLFAWQAFFNYYYFVTVLLLLGGLVLAAGKDPWARECSGR
jgi:hypothetical protein